MTVRLFRKNGEITIFLSLILSFVLGLLCVSFESARNQSIKFQEETALDASLRSCFGEYHTQLYEYYHLLFIDSSYRVSDSNLENIEDHLSAYMEENIDFEDKENSTDFFQVDVDRASINKYLLASDDGGTPVYVQATDYLAEYGDVSHSSNLQNLRSSMQFTDAEELFGGWDEALARAASFGVLFVNPAEIVRGDAQNGANHIINTTGYRNYSISYSDIPSNRNLRQGNYGNLEVEDREIIFSEYLYQNCGSIINPKNHSVMNGEIEYLLYGKKSDYENAKNCIERLIRIFAKENLGFLSASGYMLEIREYAEEIVPPPLNAEDPAAWIEREALVNAVADSLLYAWAECEAILKADRLLCGGRVIAGRSYENWILPLRQLAEYRFFFGGGGGTGFLYEEYITSFFNEVDRRILTMRFLDLVEMNIRKAGSPGFMADGCICYMKVKLEMNSAFGYEHNITRSYAYEKRYRE